MARNGRLAEDGIRLVTVEDNDQLIATAAASFFAMRAAAARDRVALSIVEPAGAYRSAWVQNDMVDHPERYNLNPKSLIKFGRSGQSHGWGNRIDVNAAAVPWMLANAARFGWSREYGARDPNHFKHDGVTATAGSGAGGFTPTIEEDDMTMMLRLFYTEAADGAQTLCIGPGNVDALRHPIYSRVWITCSHAPTPYPNLIGDLNSQEVVYLAGSSRSITDAFDARMRKRTDRISTFAQLATELAAAGEDGADSGIPGVAEFMAQIQPALDAQTATLATKIDAVPGAVIVEQKKPGN